jgi:hypothetical protein
MMARLLKISVTTVEFIAMNLNSACLRLVPFLLCVASALAYAQPKPPVATADATSESTKTVEVNRAAKIAFVEGNVFIVGPDKKRRPAKLGDLLFEGDNIVTGVDGELHLDMEDGGYLGVRPNTKMRIVKYQARGDDGDTGVFGLLQGSFRSISGWIGKYNRDKYVVRTPNATIGIRGTDHEPLVVPKGATDQESGTYDKVNEGGSFIRTPAGRTDISPNQAGFVSHDGKSRPRLLAEIPKVFRTTRNEHLLKDRHGAIQKLIDQRREDRRGEVKRKIAKNRLDAGQHQSALKQSAKEKREAALKERQEAKKAREEARLAKVEEARKKREEAKKKREELEAERAKSKAHPSHK